MKTRPEQRLRASDLPDRPMHSPLEILEVLGSRVGQGPFGLGPDKFIGVELWSVGRKRVDMEARMPLDKDADEGTAMDRTAIPQQNDVTSQMLEQMPEEADDLQAGEVGRVKPGVESQPAPAGRDGEAGDAEPLAPMPELGRLSPGSPRVTDVRDEQEPTFVDEHQMRFPPKGVFLYAATGSASSGRWPLRCAPGPAAEASGRSSPVAPSAARHARDDNESRTAGQSGGRFEAASTHRWNNPLPVGRLPNAESTEAFGTQRVSEAALEWVGHARLPCLPAGVLEPSGPPN